MALVRMQARGQMTVPQAIRNALRIGTGTELVCFQTGPDAFECHVQPVPVRLRAYLDTHQVDGPGLTQDEIDVAIAEGMQEEEPPIIFTMPPLSPRRGTRRRKR